MTTTADAMPDKGLVLANPGRTRLGGTLVARLASSSIVRSLHRTFLPAGALQRALRRSFDVLVSGIALLLLAPLLVSVGLVIRRETGGSILFRQKRIGLNGRSFDLLTFQTMVPRAANDGDTPWSIADDDQIGFFCRLLCATSVDELPQLYNVLRGDMSLVGPRPERPRYVDRHRVPVGLTGGLGSTGSVAKRRSTTELGTSMPPGSSGASGASGPM